MILALVLSINFVLSLDTENQNRLNFGHVLIVKKINTEPNELVPGETGKLKVYVYNSGKSFISDVRAKLILPSELAFIDDVSEKKISKLESGWETNLDFTLISLPKTVEGVYKATLTIYYINHIGEQKEDNYSIGIIVKSEPKIYAQIEKSELYQENRIGEITMTFINNDVANVRFLTVELLDSEDYEIISSNKKYIGDLDSDDFQSTTFKLKVKKNMNIFNLPIKISYKDALNKEYSENLELPLELKSANDLGIKKNNYTTWAIIIIILVILVLYIIKKNQGKKFSKYI